MAESTDATEFEMGERSLGQSKLASKSTPKVTAFDVYGNALSVGDRVTYFKGGRYPSIFSAEISSIKKNIKLQDVKRLNASDHFSGGWVAPSSCVLTINDKAQGV